MPPFTEILYFTYDKQKDPFHNPNVRPNEYFAALPVPSVDSASTIRHFFAPVLDSVWTTTVLITAEDLAAVPFQMQARFKIVSQQAKMSEVLDSRYGGLCFVKEADANDFYTSWDHCQNMAKVQAQRLAQEEAQRFVAMWAKHDLAPYREIVLDLTECDNLLAPTHGDLVKNHVHAWTDSFDDLPEHARTKVAQLEAKRKGLGMDIDQRVNTYAEICFERHGLSISEFFEKEQSKDHSTGDPSSTPSIDVPREAQYISTDQIGETRFRPPPYIEPAREWSFVLVLDIIQNSDKVHSGACISIPSAKSGAAAPLPHNMGFLYYQRDLGSEAENNDWVKQHLHITHYKPDVALVLGHFIVFMAEMYSTTKMVADNRGDLRRLLLRAAFYVRFMNIALQQHICLPVFYVNSDWQGECMLVFEHTDKKVYYCCLPYLNSFVFPFGDRHARAHFHLRLLNACDPRYYTQTPQQQLHLQTIWSNINDMLCQDHTESLGSVQSMEEWSSPQMSIDEEMLSVGS